MQGIKLRTVFNSVSIHKEFIRTVSVASTAEKTETKLKPWKEIPGPSSLPIIGQLHHFLPGGDLQNIDKTEGTMKLYELYGPIVRFEALLGKPPLLFLFDAESAAHVLRSENWMPLRPGFMSLEHYRKEIRKSKGHKFRTTGLVTDHGEVWKEFRSTVNPVMLQPKTIKLYCDVIDEVAQDMIIRLKAKRDENNMIRNQFDTEMNLWALESIGTVALGCRLNCIHSNLTEDSPERQIIQCIHDLFITSNKLDFMPSFWRYFPTPTYKKAMKLYEHHESLTKHFLRKGIAELKNKTNNEKGVLEKLLEINEEVAHIMASDMLFAGVDTAANTVTATLYLLATNPEKQEILRDEILSKSEKRPYLKACIKESMRMMPVVSGNLRQITKECEILGYKIPKDMQIAFGHRDMSLMEKYYPRAREYIPERWIVDKNDPLYYGNAHPFAYQPFGFGVRSCIGRRIAELEIETFLARLVENFRVEWIGGPPEVIHTSLNYIKGPYNFVFNDV